MSNHWIRLWFVVTHTIYPCSLCLARRKLEYSAFVELNQHLTEFFYKHFKSVKTWHGFNLFGIDGSTLKLFKYNDIRDHFGVMKPNKGPEVPMARVSQMFDVLNKLTIDAIISPYHVGERELLHQHMLKGALPVSPKNLRKSE